MSVATPHEVLGLPVSEPLPPTLSVDQAARLVGVSRATFYRAIAEGQWRSITVRDRVRVATIPLLEQLGLG